MRASKLTRRRFVQALGGGVGALPMLSAMDARAQGGEFPKRLLLVFSPNGTIYDKWAPTGTEDDWQLSPILAPLEPHKNDIIVLDNLRNEAGHHGPGDGHMKGMGTLWTSEELLPGTEFKCGGTDPCSGYGGGISVDQHIVNQIKPDTKFKSLELAVTPGGASVWSRMIYAGKDRPIAPMDNPADVFGRIFGELTAVDTSKFEALRDQRKSVLDYVAKRITALEPLLPAEDRDKLGAHLDAIRDIEHRLVTASPGANCAPPDKPPALKAGSNDEFPKLLTLQTDLLVSAFACDQARVASLQWSRSVGGTRMKWIGIDENHHQMSHEGDSNQAVQDKLTRINTWYAEQFADLIARMKAIPEGNGTMLDNTVIVWGNELGKGNKHSRTQIPFVMAGGGAGYFKTGRYLKYDADWHAGMLVHLCRYMGLDTDTFGNPKYVKGPLPRLA